MLEDGLSRSRKAIRVPPHPPYPLLPTPRISLAHIPRYQDLTGEIQHLKSLAKPTPEAGPRAARSNAETVSWGLGGKQNRIETDVCFFLE